MAITFSGTINTVSVIGNNALQQNLFVIQNGFKSGVNMIIRRLTLQNDNIGVLTSVMPFVKVSRATGISGGIISASTEPSTKCLCSLTSNLSASIFQSLKSALYSVLI